MILVCTLLSLSFRFYEWGPNRSTSFSYLHFNQKEILPQHDFSLIFSNSAATSSNSVRIGRASAWIGIWGSAGADLSPLFRHFRILNDFKNRLVLWKSLMLRYNQSIFLNSLASSRLYSISFQNLCFSLINHEKQEAAEMKAS